MYISSDILSYILAATYEVDLENMTSEEFDRLMDDESKANDQANQILNSIQTIIRTRGSKMGR